ncbi:MAG: hypothetical protein M3Z04_09330 [Chloroflexota bacterium]|nr:hypothetical protein [Chloroflexota bacterium]
MPIIRQNGGCVINLTGSLQRCPDTISLIHYDRDIPRYYILLEDIVVINPSDPQSLTLTVAVTFASKGYYPSNDVDKPVLKDGHSTSFSKGWAYCSFHPTHPTHSLHEAVDWLNEYALRHSYMSNPPIVSDFDEHYQHFAGTPVEFPLHLLTRGEIDQELIAAYASHFHFTVNIQQGGTGFYGTTTVNAPIIGGDVQNLTATSADNTSANSANPTEPTKQ